MFRFLLVLPFFFLGAQASADVLLTIGEGVDAKIYSSTLGEVVSVSCSDRGLQIENDDNYWALIRVPNSDLQNSNSSCFEVLNVIAQGLTNSSVLVDIKATETSIKEVRVSSLTF